MILSQRNSLTKTAKTSKSEHLFDVIPSSICYHETDKETPYFKNGLISQNRVLSMLLDGEYTFPCIITWHSINAMSSMPDTSEDMPMSFPSCPGLSILCVCHLSMLMIDFFHYSVIVNDTLSSLQFFLRFKLSHASNFSDFKSLSNEGHPSF